MTEGRLQRRQDYTVISIVINDNVTWTFSFKIKYIEKLQVIKDFITIQSLYPF